MPEFYIKKGLADKQLKDWIEEHKEEPFIRVSVEVESSHERLRRSFHALIQAWFDSGEWSANGTAEIYCYDRLRDYYKYQGCQKYIGYRYRKNNFKTLEDLYNIYTDAKVDDIDPIVKSWTPMTKKEKSRTLECLLTEIKYSMTNNQKVLEWVAKITQDVDMLNDINYYKNIKE